MRLEAPIGTIDGMVGVLAGSTAAVLLLAAGLAVPSEARAGDDGDGRRTEIRSESSCGGSGRIRLRLRGEKGEIRVDVDVRAPRRGTSWLVVVLHERRLVFRGARRAGSGSSSFSLRRTVDDWPGPDGVVVRATGPRGESCRVSATLG